MYVCVSVWQFVCGMEMGVLMQEEGMSLLVSLIAQGNSLGDGTVGLRAGGGGDMSVQRQKEPELKSGQSCQK